MFINLLDNPEQKFKVPKWIKKRNIEAILNGADSKEEEEEEVSSNLK